MTQDTSVSRILMLGLDGATYDMLGPLAAAGRLPNLARLMAESALATVNSTRPYITPVAWSTFLTGCDPQDHGIFDYRYLDHRARKVRLNHAGRLNRPTLFDAVGGEVVSLNLPMTYPAPAHLPGIVVGGLDSPSIEAALAPHPKFAARLAASGAKFDLDPVWRKKPTTFDELSRLVVATQADFRARATAALLADDMTDWRLMFVQYQTLDSLQHRAWHLLGLPGVEGAPREWMAVMQHALKALDDSVGELAELADRRGAALAVVSDHGFGGFREKITTSEVLARRGLLTLPARHAAAGYYIGRSLWKARKLLFRKLRPGRSTAHLSRPLSALMPIDWRRSLAVSLHGSLGGLLYLNTRERFGAGPIVTHAQREQAAADVVAAFAEARHPDTDEPLFEESFDTAARFQADPIERHWPDVVAIPAPGFHTRHQFDPTRRLMRPDPSLAATHRPDGVLMIRAPGATPGRMARGELRDAAPTLLHLLGIAAPPTMTGRVLQELLAAPARRRFDAPHAPAPAPAFSLGDADQREVETRLRHLGYLE
jgi:predicted AlkP superfamily phosphohydrolase/phosphomutase